MADSEFTVQDPYPEPNNNIGLFGLVA